MSAPYQPRVADGELSRRLGALGAVLIEGPKACGKTATATQVARSVIRLDTDANARTAVHTAPEVLFEQQAPILFDEWQTVPQLWNLVRRAVDDRAPQRGQVILTGSATPNDDVNRHSGAGRISVLRMRPMSLFETGHSTGQISLAGLFDASMSPVPDPGLTVRDLVDRIVIGGWPDLLDAPVQEAADWVQDYLRQIAEVDISALGTRRDPKRIHRLLAALGRGVGTEISVTALANDVGGEGRPVSRNTIDAYVAALDRLMIVEDVPAWAPHMRSRTPLRSTPTRHLADPSLGVAALGVGPEQLLGDLNAAGFHFESLVVRDLRVYSQPLGGSIHHWRDNGGHEVDIIVTLRDGRWGAFEVKMNPAVVDRAAESLVDFASKVDTTKVGAPAVLGVVTATGYGYRRPDGVYAIPVGALGP